MSITLELSPTLEKNLREKAARQGIDLGHFLQAELERLGANDAPPPRASNQLGAEESELLQKISLNLPPSFWEKYREWIRIKETRMLTAEEMEAFVKMNDQVEEANANRMKYLVELARLRQIPLKALMQELGIKAGNYV